MEKQNCNYEHCPIGERLADVQCDIKEIKSTLTGRDGIMERVTKIETVSNAQIWLMKMAITACVGACATAIVAVCIKGFH